MIHRLLDPPGPREAARDGGGRKGGATLYNKKIHMLY